MSTNPIKTAPRTESGRTAQTLLDQRAVFQDAYSRGEITKTEYDAAMAFNSQQIAAQQSYALAPTSSPAPVVVSDQRTDAWQESVDFYNSIGRPEYGGIYGKPDIPEGYTVTGVTKNAEGVLEFELYGQPTGENALDQAIEADQIRKAFMLDANTRQGTSPTGMNLQQITAGLSPEDQAAFNDYQRKTVTASMTNLGLAFAVGAAPIVAPILPIIGVAAPTVIAGEIAGVGFAAGFKAISGEGMLTLDETLQNAALGGVLSGTGSVVNTALKIGGAGIINAGARVGVNAVIGAGANAGIELVTTGKVTPENVAVGAVLGGTIGVAGEALGAGVSALKGRFTGKPVGTYDTTAYKVGKAEDIYALPEPSNAGNVARSPQQRAVMDFQTNRNLDTMESGYSDLQLGSRPTGNKPIKLVADNFGIPKRENFTIGDFNDPNAVFRSDPLSDLIAAKKYQLTPERQRIANFERDAALDKYFDNLPMDAWQANFSKPAPIASPRGGMSEEILATVVVEAPTLSRKTYADPAQFADAERLLGNANRTANLATANEALAPSESFISSSQKSPSSFSFKSSGFSSKHSSFFRSPIPVIGLDRGVSTSGGALTVSPNKFGGSEPQTGKIPDVSPSTFKVPRFDTDLGGEIDRLEMPDFNPQPQPRPQPQPTPTPIGVPDFKFDFSNQRTPSPIQRPLTNLEELAEVKTDTKTQAVPKTFTRPFTAPKSPTKSINLKFEVPKFAIKGGSFSRRGYRQSGRIYPIVTGEQFLSMGLGKAGQGLIKKSHPKSKGRKKK